MKFAFDFSGYRTIGWCWIIIGYWYISIEDSTRFTIYDLYPILKEEQLKFFKWKINIRKYK